MKETKTIRHQIYQYLKDRNFDLTSKDRAFLSDKIQDHTNNREYNLKELARQHNFTHEKISAYLKKARIIKPLTDKIKIQVETLELVKGWLNSDAE